MSRYHFESEEILRQALAGLLTRLPGAHSVKILHGQQEYGKDIVFSYRAPFGDEIVCACVVKNTKIPGRVGTRGGRELLDQIWQSLDTEFIDGRGEARRVHRAYVVSPKGITQTAMLAIRRHMEKRSGQVAFLSGYELFDLFQKFWPSYFADEADVISRYLEDLEGQIRTAKGVRQFLFLRGYGEAQEDFKDVYIPLGVSRAIFPRLLEDLGGKIREEFKRARLDSLLGQKGNLRSGGDLVDSLEEIERIFARIPQWADSLAFDVNCEIDALRFPNEPLLKRTRRLKEGVSSLLGRGKTGEERVSGFVPVTKNQHTADRSQESVQTEVGGLASKKSLEGLENAANELAFEVTEALGPLADFVNDFNERLDDADTEALDSHVSASTRELLCLEDFVVHCCGATSKETGSCRDFEYVRPPLDLFGTSFLVTGSAGSGKSSLCRWNALNDAKLASAGGGDVFPIFISLYTLAHGELSSFESVFLQSRVGSGLLPEVGAEDLVANWRVRIYLDGLDEIPVAQRREALMGLLRAGLEKYSNIQAVVTCRDSVVGSWDGWLPRLEMDNLGPDQVNRLARELLVDEDLFREFNRHLQSEEITALREVVDTPLLATLAILVFRRNRELPSSTPRLYKMFVDLLLGGWDLAKGVGRLGSFDEVVKHKVISRLALLMHTEGRRSFSPSDVGRVGADILALRGDETHRAFVDEIVEDGLVVVASGAYLFRHLSFQEYLAAVEISQDPSGQEAKDVIRRFIFEENWWAEVVRFYTGICGSPEKLFFQLKEWGDAGHKNSELALRWLKDHFPEFDLF